MIRVAIDTKTGKFIGVIPSGHQKPLPQYQAGDMLFTCKGNQVVLTRVRKGSKREGPPPTQWRMLEFHQFFQRRLTHYLGRTAPGMGHGEREAWRKLMEVGKEHLRDVVEFFLKNFTAIQAKADKERMPRPTPQALWFWWSYIEQAFHGDVDVHDEEWEGWGPELKPWEKKESLY